MTSRRVLKAASAVREVVSMAILTQIRDPRVKNVTVTYVEVSGDLRQAKIHVSIMGTEKEQSLCMHGLRSATGFLQQQVGDRIDTRYTPRLRFVLDEGVKKSVEVNRILGELFADAEHDAEREPELAEAGTEPEVAEAGTEPEVAEAGTEPEVAEADPAPERPEQRNNMFP